MGPAVAEVAATGEETAEGEATADGEADPPGSVEPVDVARLNAALTQVTATRAIEMSRERKMDSVAAGARSR